MQTFLLGNIMSLTNDLLRDDAHSLEMTGNQEDTGMSLDEEVSLRHMAQAMSLFEGEGEPENLQEQMNIIRLNRQSKTNNLAHRQALVLARARKDPLYTKYARFNGIRLQLRELIYKKYGAAALSRARQLMKTVSVGNAAPKK